MPRPHGPCPRCPITYRMLTEEERTVLKHPTAPPFVQEKAKAKSRALEAEEAVKHSNSQAIQAVEEAKILFDQLQKAKTECDQIDSQYQSALKSVGVGDDDEIQDSHKSSEMGSNNPHSRASILSLQSALSKAQAIVSSIQQQYNKARDTASRMTGIASACMAQAMAARGSLKDETEIERDSIGFKSTHIATLMKNNEQNDPSAVDMPFKYDPDLEPEEMADPTQEDQGLMGLHAMSGGGFGVMERPPPVNDASAVAVFSGHPLVSFLPSLASFMPCSRLMRRVDGRENPFVVRVLGFGWVYVDDARDFREDALMEYVDQITQLEAEVKRSRERRLVKLVDKVVVGSVSAKKRREEREKRQQQDQGTGEDVSGDRPVGDDENEEERMRRLKEMIFNEAKSTKSSTDYASSVYSLRIDKKAAEIYKPLQLRTELKEETTEIKKMNRMLKRATETVSTEADECEDRIEEFEGAIQAIAEQIEAGEKRIRAAQKKKEDLVKKQKLENLKRQHLMSVMKDKFRVSVNEEGKMMPNPLRRRRKKKV
ncbi:hypothetical protein ADUPG1_007130 [Aduncisulcus paluster]|uniref:Uncharacterized protein n=1 Tax=Aduncisulcus paluster TaxID=2918883 RepID=A0ABQ5KKU9_9EUKA|nr:hypothetical protein ADUPG1_007130 [Aduncisulcus paluster]